VHQRINDRESFAEQCMIYTISYIQLEPVTDCDGIAGSGAADHADAVAVVFATVSSSTDQSVFSRRVAAHCQEIPALELFAETSS